RGFDGARAGWLSRLAVVAQIAVSLVLVAAAGLLTRSLNALTNLDPGFRREGMLIVSADTAAAGYRAAPQAEVYRAVLRRLTHLRCIKSASLSSYTPLAAGAWWDPAEVPGYTPGPNEQTTVFLNAVSPHYFETVGAPLVAGRDFTDQDRVGAPRVAIVNE